MNSNIINLVVVSVSFFMYIALFIVYNFMLYRTDMKKWERAAMAILFSLFFFGTIGSFFSALFAYLDKL